MGLPFKSHPLYPLRRLSIIAGAVGLICCLSAINPYSSSLLFFIFVSLSCSIIFCATDVLLFAVWKVEHPNDESNWPKKWWMLGDFVLAAWLMLIFLATFADPGFNRYDTFGIPPTYAAVFEGLCSLVHAVAFWEQLMKWHEKKWLTKWRTEHAQVCCVHCRHQTANPALTSDNEPPFRDLESQREDRDASDPSGACSLSDTSTPEDRPGVPTPIATETPTATELAMEEGLLIGLDQTVGYGAISEPETTVDQPQEITVVGKGKGKGKKKRLVSDAEGNNAESSTAG